MDERGRRGYSVYIGEHERQKESSRKRRTNSRRGREERRKRVLFLSRSFTAKKPKKTASAAAATSVRLSFSLISGWAGSLALHGHLKSYARRSHTLSPLPPPPRAPPAAAGARYLLGRVCFSRLGKMAATPTSTAHPPHTAPGA